MNYQDKLEFPHVQKTDWSLYSYAYILKILPDFFRATILLCCKLTDLGVFCFVFPEVFKHLDKTFCTLLLFIVGF